VFSSPSGNLSSASWGWKLEAPSKNEIGIGKATALTTVKAKRRVWLAIYLQPSAGQELTYLVGGQLELGASLPALAKHEASQHGQPVDGDLYSMLNSLASRAYSFLAAFALFTCTHCRCLSPLQSAFKSESNTSGSLGRGILRSMLPFGKQQPLFHALWPG